MIHPSSLSTHSPNSCSFQLCLTFSCLHARYFFTDPGYPLTSTSRVDRPTGALVQPWVILQPTRALTRTRNGDDEQQAPAHGYQYHLPRNLYVTYVQNIKYIDISFTITDYESGEIPSEVRYVLLLNALCSHNFGKGLVFSPAAGIAAPWAPLENSLTLHRTCIICRSSGALPLPCFVSFLPSFNTGQGSFHTHTVPTIAFAQIVRASCNSSPNNDEPE